MVFNKDNWMDVPSKDRPGLIGFENVKRKIEENASLNPLQKTTKQADWLAKFNARTQSNDIIEAREDGYGLCGDEPLSFALIIVPMLLKDALQYTVPLAFPDIVDLNGDITESGHPIYERKYSLDISGIVLDEDKTAALTLIQFHSLLAEKT